MLPLRRLRELIPALAGKRVVVVGDIIADEYLYGKPARISREAPVLILRFTDREVRLGGAANATDNVHALGAVATPVGVVGGDEAGQELTRLFAGAGISRIVERVKAAGARADAFLLSDYGYGTVTPRVFETVSEIARRRDLLVTVDSRYDLPRFRGVTAATPNEPEVEELASAELSDEPSLEKAGRAVLDRLEARYLLITRGSRGMALLEREGPVTWIPIHGSDQIADVTGAGDTVISAFTTALAAGAAPAEAAWLANVAGGVVVMKRGTAAATPRELLESLAGDDTASRP
ncbi:MAG: sugar kinase [Candidatus Rokuibacteriota bacterium]|nr:MAG: sugar kinase [Candidatus Rokubacteria bacterium]